MRSRERELMVELQLAARGISDRRVLAAMATVDRESFVPVDRAVALTRNPQGSWKMPARALYRRLLEKCNGRVVRSDIGWAADPAKAASKATEKDFVGMATAAEWKKWGEEQGRVRVGVSAEAADWEPE